MASSTTSRGARSLSPPRDEHINWLESNSTRDWARSNLARQPPPSFQSNERDLVSHAIEEDVQLLEHIDLEIKHLILQRQEVEARIAKRQAILAPIRFLCPDIFSCILSFIETPSFPDGVQELVSLMLVSKSWMEVINRTPRFFTKLDISAPKKSKPLNWSYDSLQSWLAKSGTHLLDIKIVGMSGSYDLISKRSNQWRELILEPSERLTCSEARDLREIFSNVGWTKSLTTLAISDVLLWSLEYEYNRDAPFIFDGLQSLTWSNPQDCDFYPDIIAPNLTSLTLIDHNLPFVMLNAFGETFPNITELALCRPRGCDHGGQGLTVNFANLQMFTFIAPGNEVYCNHREVFRCAPALATFTTCLSTLLGLLVPSSDILTCLIVDVSSHHPWQWVLDGDINISSHPNLIGIFPNLEYLQLDMNDKNSTRTTSDFALTLIRSLTLSTQEGGEIQYVCSKLRMLVCQWFPYKERKIKIAPSIRKALIYLSGHRSKETDVEIDDYFDVFEGTECLISLVNWHLTLPHVWDAKYWDLVEAFEEAKSIAQ